MAAAPTGSDNLNYEAEEVSILTATRSLGLDLVVEESGELGLLSACVAREKPDVIQISCHGTLKPEPALLLEDETGGRAMVKTSQLVGKLASHHPRLLFLSACETAEADTVLDFAGSLAGSIRRACGARLGRSGFRHRSHAFRRLSLRTAHRRRRPLPRHRLRPSGSRPIGTTRTAWTAWPSLPELASGPAVSQSQWRWSAGHGGWAAQVRRPRPRR